VHPIAIERWGLPNIVVIAQQNNEIAKLCSELNKQGFQCSIINGNNAIEKIGKNTASLLLIEFNGSPDTEALCRYFHREKGLPIIALAPIEKLDSINGYVDDFIIKPCNAKELETRVKRLIKKESDVSKAQITIGDIVIDTDKYEVYIDGKPVSLTFKEYELLKFLASHPGRVFSRDSLLNQVWSEDYFGGDRTVDVHIRRLRSKIEDPSHIYIETVRNIGYRFIKK
jgi:DNA-binding response OmpR family regulator